MSCRRLPLALAALFFAALSFAALPAGAASDAPLEPLVFPEPNEAALRARGARVMDELADLYLRSTPERRDTIAVAFYRLGIKSDAAKAALLQDVHTPQESLRLHVQWALGRVSADDDVVDTLVDIMRRDRSPLFRDKAACALTYDQIHLGPRQKARLFELLIAALRDDNAQVRAIALQSLSIQTGQTKGYRADGPPAEREEAARTWDRWLKDYRAAL